MFHLPNKDGEYLDVSYLKKYLAWMLNNYLCV